MAEALEIGETEPLDNLNPHHPWLDDHVDLVLRSQDGTLFPVHSVMLKSASGFFRSMLGIPRDAKEDPSDPIPMEESSEVLATLLNIVYHISLPSTDNVDQLEQILARAEKYDMSSVLSIIRFIVSAESLAGHLDPLISYAIGCRYGWEDIAKSASTRTLDIDISTLSDADAAKIGLGCFLKLQRFHRIRRDKLFDAMSPPTPPSPTDPTIVIDRVHISNCVSQRDMRPCCLDRVRCPAWKLLKHCIAREMEKRPSGIVLRRNPFWDREDFEDLWKSFASYSGCSCNSWCPPLDRLCTKTEVLRFLDSNVVPKTI
ncbi:hypothetical protein BD410DRAFT_792540 [Rickenella mellea]|uniref:BTB domain-containing protein n=1 Tax=Rickenella mellea TaxID=50990 RepID=A0A4Y7PX61_9AGAM|nr:hypothetical protein BD410DRAFT_792540 [Rickenella mellea]